MEAQDNHSLTNLGQQQKKLFHIYNTPQGFIGEICYTHLGSRNCSCKNKNSVGRVKELASFYESASFNNSLEGTNISLYELHPSVLERIKNYERRMR